MDGGPTIHGIYPARQRGAYKRFGGFAPGWGAPAPHPLTSRPPPPAPAAARSPALSLFCCQRFLLDARLRGVRHSNVCAQVLQAASLVIGGHVTGHLTLQPTQKEGAHYQPIHNLVRIFPCRFLTCTHHSTHNVVNSHREPAMNASTKGWTCVIRLLTIMCLCAFLSAGPPPRSNSPRHLPFALDVQRGNRVSKF